MNSYQTLLVSLSGAVAFLTLNRPEKLNAINEQMRSDLEAALRALDDDEGVRVVVIKGAGRAFCSGYDMGPTGGAGQGRPIAVTPADSPDRPSIMQDRDRLRKSIERWLWLWNYRKPLIAQIHGYCLAGGGDLAAMCDLIYCADDARFGHPAGRAMGIPQTLGLWPLRLGMLKSKELLFTGDAIDGVEAERIGMVNKSLPPAGLDRHVAELAARIARVPSDALTIHKQVVNRWFEIMGLRTAVAECAEFDAIYHQTPSALAFARIASEQGLKAAFAWRDSPFSEASDTPSKKA